MAIAGDHDRAGSSSTNGWPQAGPWRNGHRRRIWVASWVAETSMDGRPRHPLKGEPLGRVVLSKDSVGTNGRGCGRVDAALASVCAQVMAALPTRRATMLVGSVEQHQHQPRDLGWALHPPFRLTLRCVRRESVNSRATRVRESPGGHVLDRSTRDSHRLESSGSSVTLPGCGNDVRKPRWILSQSRTTLPTGLRTNRSWLHGITGSQRQCECTTSTANRWVNDRRGSSWTSRRRSRSARSASQFSSLGASPPMPLEWSGDTATDRRTMISGRLSPGAPTA